MALCVYVAAGKQFVCPKESIRYAMDQDRLFISIIFPLVIDIPPTSYATTEQLS